MTRPSSAEAATKDSLSHFLTTSIILADYDLCNGDPNWVPDAEPLPQLDYHLVYNLINLRHGKTDRRELKRYDYLTQSRRFYYNAYYNFQTAYWALQDAYSHRVLLDREKINLEKVSVSKQKKLCHNKNSIQKNDCDLLHCLWHVNDRKQRLERAAVSLGEMKRDFVQSEMPLLIESGKIAYRKAMIQQQGIKSPPPFTVAPLLTNPPISIPA